MKRRLLLGSAASSLLALAHPAWADGPYIGAAPAVEYAEPFRWAGCYGGIHLGGAWASKSATDPVALVQGAPSPTGVATVNPNPDGFIIGGQIGCDYQFPSRWVIGLEGAVSASTIKGSVTTALPLGNPGEQANVRASVDLIPSITGRVGYAWDRWLLYAKGGVAWASDSYSVVGNFTGAPFDFTGNGLRTGWTVGAGVEKAIWDHWSVRLEYDYYDFGSSSIAMVDNVSGASGALDVKQTVQAVRFGLNFHPAW
jgi:outer membrane immunogenic protein